MNLWEVFKLSLDHISKAKYCRCLKSEEKKSKMWEMLSTSGSICVREAIIKTEVRENLTISALLNS